MTQTFALLVKKPGHFTFYCRENPCRAAEPAPPLEYASLRILRGCAEAAPSIPYPRSCTSWPST